MSDTSKEACKKMIMALEAIPLSSAHATIRCSAAAMIRALLDRAEKAEEKYHLCDGMGGAVTHSIRELLNHFDVPKSAYIDDHVGNAIYQRDAANARVKTLEKALKAIDDLLSSEITARFGGHQRLSEKDAGSNNRLYPLLDLPRNMARAALETKA
jgi:hypothetical protein